MRPKRPKRVKEKRYPKEERGKILLESVTLGDDATLAKYSITARTLQRWRKSFREGSDAELSACVAEKKAALDKAWADKIPDALAECLDFIRRAAKSADVNNPDVIRAMAGAMKMIAETDGTYRMIDARISGQDRGNGKETGSVPAGSNVTPIRRAAG